LKTDSIWLHIRCAGGWTNKLYDFFEHQQSKQLLRSNNNNDKKNNSAVEPTAVASQPTSKYISPQNQSPAIAVRHQSCVVSVSLPIEPSDQNNLQSETRKMKLTPRASYAPETLKNETTQISQPTKREEKHIFQSLEVYLASVISSKTTKTISIEIK
jgi:hypothetical protein